MPNKNGLFVLTNEAMRRLGKQAADEIETILTGDRDCDRLHTMMSDVAEIEFLRGVERRVKELIHLRETEITAGCHDGSAINEVDQELILLMDRLSIGTVSIAFIETPPFDAVPAIEFGDAGNPKPEGVDPYAAPYVVLPGENESDIFAFWNDEDISDEEGDE